MQEAKHTPGPWWLGEEGEDFGSHTPIHAKAWGSLAQVVTEMADEGESAEGRANARLIAAAPELLEALQWAMGRIERLALHSASEGDAELYEMVSARAVLGKATGAGTNG